MRYQHISIEEREKIQELLWKGISIRSIAKELGRNTSSISREINRNKSPVKNTYTPRIAQVRSDTKKKSRGRKERLKNDRIRSYVVTHLKMKWSPEQIAGRIHIDLKETISHEAIYQYIYNQIHRNGYGYVKPQHEDLRQYLRRRHKRRQRKGMRKSHCTPHFNGVSIENRPKIVDRRTRIGDWETDTVESCKGKVGVNTLLERKSGLYLISKLKSKRSESYYQSNCF
ncbi:MAG: IS30 family transposase [Parcubacteria group bacterium]|nr:IS30 family transposase [Parcubacteria group bacterium]